LCSLMVQQVSKQDHYDYGLRNLKAVAGEGRCTLMATDTEVGIRLDVQGLTIEDAGEAILPAKKLTEILRESRDAEMSIDAGPDRCLVKGSSGEFEMASDDVAGFPDFPDFDEGKCHEITAASLAQMVKRVLFAAADDSTRYSMTGASWELDGDKARLVATDGRRLALAEGLATSVGGHTTKGTTPVVPTKAMKLLERVLADDPEETVKVAFRGNEVLFRTGRAVVYSRLVEGRFPDWRGVIPKKNAAKATLATAPFHAAVRQAAIMTDTESKRVAFHFTPEKLTLQAQASASGRSRIELPVAEYEGPGVSINFNPDYLNDFLKVLSPDDPLELHMTDGAKPALFKSGDSYSYLVMPLT
ncbi:MAG: DNA polymerase III subunit beta, partial [Gemmataceae bacterium]|nr:DNA polymerase III subunit beta [Gemmataceae bacterium]